MFYKILKTHTFKRSPGYRGFVNFTDFLILEIDGVISFNRRFKDDLILMVKAKKKRLRKRNKV